MNLDGFFRPKSIAIVGASRRKGSLGRMFFDALLNFDFKGKIYPVNPKTEEIEGILCYASVEKIPEIPELGVILVRKELALTAAETCGKKGIHNLIMITAGFREVGGEGIERENQLLKIIRKYRMRMIGPNCMGIINTDPAVSMNASFSPTEPFTGNVAFISQSGALGVAVLEISKTLRLGFSIFVSVGNKADLTDTDFLEYLENHPRTKVITLYQESLENTTRFREVVSRISRKKPVIALKAGRSESGAKAAASHTGALASSDIATEAFFKQCGILRVGSLEELFEQSQAFSNQPIPRGNRIAVITNAGGPAILATDAIEKYRLKMAKFLPETKDRLREFLPEEAAVHNPVDMIASANEKTYRRVLEIVQADPNVDAVIIIIVRPPVSTTPGQIVEYLKEPLELPERKPVFVVLMAQQDKSSGLESLQQLHLPVYSYPESAARSIAAMLKYRKQVQKPTGKISRFEVEKNDLKAIFTLARKERREYLASEEIEKILRAYHFPLPYSKLVGTAEDAIEVWQTLKKPLVLKIESPDIVHKSDIGGVKIDLNSPEKIQNAFDTILKNSLQISRRNRITGVLVQEMILAGREIVFGLKRDPNYGPLIMFGLGGIHVEVFKDVCFRIAPLTDQDAREMVEEIKGYRILQGIRGEKAVAIDFIVQLLQRLSQLALDWPEIIEMDLNPIKVFPEPENCKVIDARIRIH